MQILLKKYIVKQVQHIKKFTFIPLMLLSILFVTNTFAQETPANLQLNYYLPTKTTTYNSAIPTPASILGFEVGKWHVSHDKLVEYMRALATASDRISLREYARSYEDRPLVLLTITSPENHKNLENIRQQHVALSRPSESKKIDTKDMPVVVYQGYSIHGNESSGTNAALLIAYHLAAAQDATTDSLLRETVVLFDPCMNPDGLHRFATWVNMHKSQQLIADPFTREHNEVWPGGRTNHYWFDLNRDWLLTQHPESQGRVTIFHEWKPNILTDHHEMGTNATYFFQPGVASRVNPMTPKINQELTQQIAEFHAEALDEIGSLYFTQEWFDDFYIGKGSTYPDVNACVGVLFEQASSRGHLQNSDNGLLSFPFTIRNQVKTSFSTLTAARKLRTDLLEFQRNFYQEAIQEAKEDRTQAYIFSEEKDLARLYHFIELLQRHKIEVFENQQDIAIDKHKYVAQKSYVVPLQQPQYRLIKALFETQTSFTDSLFYDVSSWTLPLAFNIQYDALDDKQFSSKKMATTDHKIDKWAFPTGKVIGGRSDYAYLFAWDGYYAPKAVNKLLRKKLRIKVATKTFSTQVGDELKEFDYGTILVPLQNQAFGSGKIYKLLQKIAKECGITVYALSTGFTPKGMDIGSPSFQKLNSPKTLLLVGRGVTSYDAGEIWHLLDNRYNIPLSMADVETFNKIPLEQYNTLIMVNGKYNNISDKAFTKLQDWLKKGGVLIGMKSAAKWASDKKLSNASFKKRPKKNKPSTKQKAYKDLSADLGAKVIGGAIFEAQIDPTHPLGYGYHNATLPIFKRGTLFLERPRNAYAAPITFTDSPLISGYISEENKKHLKNSAVAVVSAVGKGRVICFSENPNFRAFWYGTNKLMMNALFFGRNIANGATEKPKPVKKKEKK